MSETSAGTEVPARFNRDDVERLRAVTGELSAWADVARGVLEHRSRAATEANSRIAALRSKALTVAIRGDLHWRALPLRDTDREGLSSIAHAATLPALSNDETAWLDALATVVTQSLHNIKSLSGLRRIFSGSASRQAAGTAARYLLEYHAWATAVGIPRFLTRVDDRTRPVVNVPVAAALNPETGLLQAIADLGQPKLLSSAIVAQLPRSVQTIESALRKEETTRKRVVQAGSEVRRAETLKLVEEMPVERLRDATQERIRTAPLTDAGIRTVRDVFKYGDRIGTLPGIGETTSARIQGAAQTIWQETYTEMPVRIDIKNRSAETTALLQALNTWDATRKTKNAGSDLARAEALTPLAIALDPSVMNLIVFAVDAAHDDFIDAVSAVNHRASVVATASGTTAAADPWQDFMARPADYFAMLNELGFITEDEAAVEGDLPDEVITAIRDFELNTEFLSASLRGYQSFAARFALVQRKVIIGDEMGLGKTVEAIAAFTHLRAKGSQHCLVICPAAVVTNWMREVQSKSELRAHRLHGQGRDTALRSWRRYGGVGVTTYESLAWFLPWLVGIEELACVALDEAHYIKNPAAKRSIRAAEVIERAERAVLLTGTPLENRVDEFRNLVGYVRPDLVVDATDLRPRLFRKQVAPAYLRRNQADVLTELPELVEVDEWLPMSHADATAYRAAVYEGNFQTMRQAAMLQGKHSEKIHRLVEIVEEAEDNGRRVIVFSNYREVLEAAKSALPGRVFGPITGSVPASRRQQTVDDFSAAEHGAVLLAQIVAGGVGLNIQAASVVVICEPQLKPTTEWQAIARARRMGQLDSVQVHRLLSEEGVDLRVTEILERKRAVFADFAAISDLADGAPESVDVSDADSVREVIAAERQRLYGGLPTE